MVIKYLGTDALAHLCSLIKSALAGKAESSHKHAKADIKDFPASLKNPQALKIDVTSGSGATSKTYDGSTAQTLEINTTPGANGGVAKTDIVQNATTAATDKVPSAAVAKNLQDQLNALNTKNTASIIPETSCFLSRPVDDFNGWLTVHKIGDICQLDINVGIFYGNSHRIFSTASLPNGGSGYSPVYEINQVVMDTRTAQLYRLYIADGHCGIQSLSGTEIPEVAYVRTTLFYMVA